MSFQLFAAWIEDPISFLPVIVDRWIDGDTLKCRVSVGFGIEVVDVTVRLFGVDAPEKVGKTLSEGLNSEFFANNLAPSGCLAFLGIKEKKIDRYGRIVANLYVLKGGAWIDVGAEMVKAKKARRLFY